MCRRKSALLYNYTRLHEAFAERAFYRIDDAYDAKGGGCKVYGRQDKAEEKRAQFSQGADISAFQQLPFVLIKRGNRTRNIVDQYFSRYYFKPKLILETENTVTTLAMAQAGVGVTICPELFLRAIPNVPAERKGVDIFPLTDPSTFGKLVAGYRGDRYLSHFGERFIALAAEAVER